MLQAILNICEGQSTQRVVVGLSHDIELFQKDLASNTEALNWFNLSTPAVSPPLTPPVGPTPLPGQSIDHTQHHSSIDFLNDRRPCLPSPVLLQLFFCAHSITFRIEFEYFVAYSIFWNKRSSELDRNPCPCAPTTRTLCFDGGGRWLHCNVKQAVAIILITIAIIIGTFVRNPGA